MFRVITLQYAESKGFPPSFTTFAIFWLCKLPWEFCDHHREIYVMQSLRIELGIEP